MAAMQRSESIRKDRRDSSDWKAGFNRRYLAFHVGARTYASPLGRICEIIDSNDHEGLRKHLSDARVHVARTGSANDVLGTSIDHRANDQHRPLIVVDIGEYVGLYVDEILGMVVVRRVYHVPEGITTLPRGSIVGAFPWTSIITPTDRDSMANAPREDQLCDQVPKELTKPDRQNDRSLMTSPPIREDEIVFVIDLVPIAGAVFGITPPTWSVSKA